MFLGTDFSYAQRATLSGVITDFETGQSLEGANVTLKGLQGDEDFVGAAADKDGYYFISSIRPGRYLLRVSFIGYKVFEDTLTFEPGDAQTLNKQLELDDSNLEEVVVEYNRGAALRESGRQRVTSVELNRIPAPVAGGDLVSYLQTLPGVVSLGGRGGQVFIRGGMPSENMVLVDGALIYRPFHIVGFFSPFPDNLVSTADFYAGGFNSSYSGRISSVLDIKMRHGDRFGFGGSASISPFVASVQAEGPITKGKSSWLVSIRNSIIEETSPHFLSEAQPLKFQSQFVKMSIIEKETRCSSSLLRTYDRGKIDFEKDESIQWSNFLLAGQCQILPENSTNFVQLNVNVSRMSNETSNNAGRGLHSKIFRFNTDASVTNHIGKQRLDYGMFLRIQSLGYNLVGQFSNINNDEYTLYNLGAFVQLPVEVGRRLTLEPGTVISMYPGRYPTSIEPRFRVTLQPFARDKEELSAAIGVYRQAVVGISDMRDASSVFTVWLRNPLGNEQMEAIHGLLGWQQEIGAGFSWSVEGYYKKMSNLPVTVWSTIARISTELSQADGEVVGADARLEFDSGWFYGLLGYGISETTYSSAQENFGLWFGEPVQSYNPPHDRRHQVNATVSMEFGIFTAGIRWQYGSGLPFTRPIGFDEVLFFNDGVANVEHNLGTQRIILEKPYLGRLPVYHRLDISLERYFKLGKSETELGAKVGAVNVYDHANLFYYDVYTQRRVDQLSFAPYASLEIEF